MKLYIAWELKGKLVTSPRPPIDLSVDYETQQEFATVGPTPFLIWWLEDPERSKFYYDILYQLLPIMGHEEAYKQTLWMCFKMMSHFLGDKGIIVTGVGITLTEAVRDALLAMTAVIKSSAVLTHIVLGAGIVVFLYGILFILNPKVKGTRTITWGRGRWLMCFEEKLWWADLVGCSLKGTDMFTRCEEIEGEVVINARGWRGQAQYGVVPGDTIQFYGTWIESGWKGLLYETVSWSTLKASYVGLLKNVGAPYYVLLKGFNPTWVGESEPGWTKDQARWCMEPQHEIKDTTI